MEKIKKPVMTIQNPSVVPVVLEAEPEPVQIDLGKTAIMLIDMLNTFVWKAGFFDSYGYDISKCQEILAPIKKIINSARSKGVKVIYIASSYSPDFQDAGTRNSPNWYKNADFYFLREHPEWHDKFLIRGTWGAEIVDELKPQQGDIIIEKQRYSAFVGTNLDDTLKAYNIRYIVFTGIATNVCVESTVRNAFFLDYFPILISDAVAPAGPLFLQEATEFNVKMHFGWVTSTENLMSVLT